MDAPGRPDIPCYTCPARNSPLCSAFGDLEIPELYDKADRVHIEAGDYLYREDDPNPYVYNVVDGLLMLERLASNGKRQIMAFVYPGDLIGLAPEDHYTVSAKCLKKAELCRFRIDALEAMFNDFPKLERRMRRIANRILSHALDQVFVLGHKNAVERMAFFFLHLAERQKIRSRGATIVELPMTRTDIADFLGITVETASRAMSRLKADGLIRMPTLNRVEIPDFDSLQQAADNYGSGT